ncbi:hypothetical protein HMPREF3226_00393 [Prevotella corporis]|uniref:Uncharacterized protein n=1 Tax=Prevotella corporis TaxID=28128 RepID=A0A133QL71_9BACT|nr:hypothetical protein HMPREF3226_00393 [Prevotella corporis]
MSFQQIIDDLLMTILRMLLSFLLLLFSNSAIKLLTGNTL